MPWLGGLVNKQNGGFDEAIRDFDADPRTAASSRRAGRGFDFSRDYRLLNELGADAATSGPSRSAARSAAAAREALLREAVGLLEQALAIDPENLSGALQPRA